MWLGCSWWHPFRRWSFASRDCKGWAESDAQVPNPLVQSSSDRSSLLPGKAQSHTIMALLSVCWTLVGHTERRRCYRIVIAPTPGTSVAVGRNKTHLLLLLLLPALESLWSPVAPGTGSTLDFFVAVLACDGTHITSPPSLWRSMSFPFSRP